MGIAQQNGLGDVVTFIQGKVEEVELPVDEVDIIISEWMGYFLIYESMLDSVLFARDKWLRKDGHLFPDHARLYMAGIEDADYKEEPLADTVDETSIATDVCCLLELDLKTCTKSDLDFLAPYSLRLQRKDFVHAL